MIKDLSKYLPLYIVPAVVRIIAIPIITRLFSPADYGNYALVLAEVFILSAIATAWINDSIIRFYPAYKLNNHSGNLLYNIIVAL